MENHHLLLGKSYMNGHVQQQTVSLAENSHEQSSILSHGPRNW